MSMWDRPVDPGGLPLPGSALERRDWAHVPCPQPRAARLLRITQRVSEWGGRVYVALWISAIVSVLVGVPHQSALFSAFFVAFGVSLIGSIAHSLVAGRADSRTLRIHAGRGVFATGSRTWPLRDIVGVVVDLDEGTTRHVGVRDAASCRVALVLREHLVSPTRTRDDRRDTAVSSAGPNADQILAAAERSFATATILQGADAEDASEAASGLARYLGVPMVEV